MALVLAVAAPVPLFLTRTMPSKYIKKKKPPGAPKKGRATQWGGKKAKLKSKADYAKVKARKQGMAMALTYSTPPAHLTLQALSCAASAPTSDADLGLIPACTGPCLLTSDADLGLIPACTGPCLPVSSVRVFVPPAAGCDCPKSRARGWHASSSKAIESLKRLSHDVLEDVTEETFDVFKGCAVSAVCSTDKLVNDIMDGQVLGYVPKLDSFLIAELDYNDGSIREDKPDLLVRRLDLEAMLVGRQMHPVTRKGGVHRLDRPWNHRDGGFPNGRKCLHVVDLFCGTKSVFKTLLNMVPRDWTLTYVSLDHDPDMDADIVCDVKYWKSKLKAYGFSREHPPDILWASPDCRFFSLANNKVTETDLEEARRLVKCTIAAIKHLKPAAWFIENPRGRLRDQEIMQTIPHLRYTVTYCMYGKQYWKPTDIFTNVQDMVLNFCCNETPCSHRQQGCTRHSKTAQSGPSSNGTPGVSREEAFEVPDELMHVLMNHAVHLALEVRWHEKDKRQHKRRA